MKAQQIHDDWPVLAETDPPHDLSRELAAFERERERLVRDHLGKIAVILGDEVVGIFPTLQEAEAEGHRRFGSARLVFRPISGRDEPEYIANVDLNHPSFQRLDGLPWAFTAYEVPETN